MKWVVSSSLPSTNLEFSNRIIQYFLAKLFVKKANEEERIHDSSSKFDFEDKFLSQGIDLPNNDVK